MTDPLDDVHVTCIATMPHHPTKPGGPCLYCGQSTHIPKLPSAITTIWEVQWTTPHGDASYRLFHSDKSAGSFKRSLINAGDALNFPEEDLEIDIRPVDLYP